MKKACVFRMWRKTQAFVIAPRWVRTTNLRFRRPMLYPIALGVREAVLYRVWGADGKSSWISFRISSSTPLKDRVIFQSSPGPPLARLLAQNAPPTSPITVITPPIHRLALVSFVPPTMIA